MNSVRTHKHTSLIARYRAVKSIGLIALLLFAAILGRAGRAGRVETSVAQAAPTMQTERRIEGRVRVAHVLGDPAQSVFCMIVQKEVPVFVDCASLAVETGRGVLQLRDATVAVSIEVAGQGGPNAIGRVVRVHSLDIYPDNS